MATLLEDLLAVQAQIVDLTKEIKEFGLLMVETANQNLDLLEENRRLKATLADLRSRLGEEDE